MSDSPTAFTGFGTVTRQVLCGLKELGGFEVASIGWGHDGWPHDRQHLPFDIYPSRGQPFGMDSARRAIAGFRPDVFVGFGDLWMIDWMRDLLDGNQPFKSLAYFPIDGDPFPPAWKLIVEAVDLAATCSTYGQRVVEEACPDLAIEMIYHGVDTSVFRPLEEAEGYKEKHGLKDKFVVGCVARNQPRKHFPILIDAFATFCSTKPDAMLYLHTDPDDIGWDILDLLRRAGIADRTCISRQAAVDDGVDDIRLNEIYNLFDVMALPSASEGFGLPILEAMAAGVPVVTTDHAAGVELVRGRGELVDVQVFSTVGRFNLRHAIPDVDDLVSKLDLLYYDAAHRSRCAREGLAFAQTLDWKPIVEQWAQVLHSFGSTRVEKSDIPPLG